MTAKLPIPRPPLPAPVKARREVQIHRIPNMLTPTGRSTTRIPWRGNHLSNYLLPGDLEPHQRVIVSGRGEVMAEELDGYTLAPGDEVIVVPEVKDPVSVFLAAVAIAIDVAVVAGIGYGVNALASSFLGPKTPSLSGGKQKALNDSPTYSWDGIQNTSNAAIPYPVIYGKHRVGGNIVQAFVENIGNDSILSMDIVIGHGPVQSIAGITAARYNEAQSGTTEAGYAYSNSRYRNIEALSDFTHPIMEAMCDEIGAKLKINGNPISDFAVPGPDGDCPAIALRYGDDDQPAFTWFGSTHAFRSYNDQLFYLQDQDYTLEKEDTEEINLLFESPALFEVKKSGIDDQSVIWQVFYREVDDTSGPYDGFYRADGPLSNGRWNMNGETNAPLRSQVRITDLSPGQYIVRIRKLVGDSSTDRQSDLYLTGIDEISKRAAFAHPGIARLALRMKANERLRGSLPTVTTEVEGQNTVEIWNGSSFEETYSRNPIWCARHFMLNKTFGMGEDIEADAISIYDDRWIEAADYCDGSATVYSSTSGGGTETRYLLDLVIDGRLRGPDVRSLFAAACACFFVTSAGAIFPVIDKAETTPTQLFGMGNIIRGSFQEQCASFRDTPNVVEIQYHDANNDYERNAIEIANYEDIDAGGSIRREAIFIPGVTSRSQATRLGAQILNDFRFNKLTVSFRAFPEAISCQAGDVVNISHDLPQWGESGRLKAGTTSSFTAKNNITLAAPDSGEANMVYVMHGATDVIEEREISSAPGFYAAGTPISVTPDFDNAPGDYDLYQVGILQSKPFRIVGMALEQNGEVQITAVEHNPEVYDLLEAVPPPDYSQLPNPRRTPPAAENLSAINVGGYSMEVLVSWSLPQTTPGERETNASITHFEIWVAEGQDPSLSAYSMADTTARFDFKLTETTPRTKYSIKVVSVSRFAKTPLATAPSVSIVAIAGPPPVVTGIRLKGRPNEYEFFEPSPEFEWNPVSNSNTAVSPFGGGGTPAGGIPDRYFDHFVVQFYSLDENGVGVLRSEYHTRDPRFKYDIEMNRQDQPSGKAARLIAIGVYVVDTYGNVSPQIGSLSVVNNPPAAPEHLLVTKIQKTGVGFIGYELTWDRVDEPDVTGYRVFRACTINESVNGNLDHLDPERILSQLGVALWYFVGEFSDTKCFDDSMLGGAGDYATAFYIAPIDHFVQDFAPSRVTGNINDFPTNWDPDDLNYVADANVSTATRTITAS